MNTRANLASLLLLAAAACGLDSESGPFDLGIVANDPCNQVALFDRSLDLELLRARIDSVSGTQEMSVTAAEAAGMFMWEGIDQTQEATLSVEALDQTGVVRAATTVGFVNLTRDDTRWFDAVLGRTDRFMRTTDTRAATDGTVFCTSLTAERMDHTASRLPDGKVLVAGGAQLRPTSTTFWEGSELYDPVAGQFTTGPQMNWVRGAHTATVLDDGMVLLAGGIGLVGTTLETWRTALLYDPSANAVDQPTLMTDQRAHHTATLLDNGRVLVAGGEDDTTELRTTEIYDPDTRSFCSGPMLTEARAHHAAVYIGNDTVALIGGTELGRALDSIEFVHVASCHVGTTTVGPHLRTARSHLSAGRVPDTNAVLIAGGTSATDPTRGGATDAVEILLVTPENPTSSTMVCDGLTLGEARAAASFAPIPGGFLIAGGFDNLGNALASAEKLLAGDLLSCDVSFEPTAGSLSVARAGMTATPLVGGDLLLTGGFSTAAYTHADAEIYVWQR